MSQTQRIPELRLSITLGEAPDIAEMLIGDLSLASKLGEGTRVEVRVPLDGQRA